MTESQAVTRIIDVNLNRASEGLRFLEELARFTLNDATLTEKLKTLRHELVAGDFAFNRAMLLARQAESDVGADITALGQEGQELSLLAVANSRRVQEALRVLEELAKLRGSTPLSSTDKYRHARFSLYTLEQELVFRLMRKDKVKLIYGLYPVLDTQALKGRSHLEVARQIIKGGAKVIQLRDKVSLKKDLCPIALGVRKLCQEAGVLFIMNDYLDLALATDADGLHVGQEDLPAREARRLLPMDKILGVSCRSVPQAVQAEKDGADYVGHGSIYPTTSKEDASVVGLTRLADMRRAISLPVVAIGGITLDRVREVMAAGAQGVAVISAILGAESPEEATREALAKIEAGLVGE